MSTVRPVNSDDPRPLTPDPYAARQFPCKQCGAKLEFAPDAQVLKCPYCGFENAIAIAPGGGGVEELDFRAVLSRQGDESDTHEAQRVKCSHCGAETTMPAEAAAGLCPFCGSSIVFTGQTSRLIKPGALLPFAITRDAAFNDFRAWINALWFAPTDLKQYARSEDKLVGVYVPYWTYDCDTRTAYTGERGDDYTETEEYTTIENGKEVTKTRQVTKTRWTSVRGTVDNAFDDILILASKSLPEKYADRLEPWDLDHLVPYADDYLSGFRAESYQVDLVGGFDEAREVMVPAIRQTIERDIGGDHQTIDSVDTRYSNITFKHILLPVWLSAYRYRDQVYRILINARTGEVQGERPWSAWKIMALVAGALAAAATIAAVVMAASQR